MGAESEIEHRRQVGRALPDGTSPTPPTSGGTRPTRLALGDGPKDVFDGEAKMIHGSDKTQSQASTNVANANEIVQRLEQAEGRYETMALWMDLLGFRTHLDRENWDLHGEQTKLGMKRIAAMHEVGLLSMNDRYEVVQLNDAIVISQDMPTEGAQNAVEQFLALVDYNFEMAVLTDSRIGGVGIRAVVAKGVRYNLRGNLGWTSQEADPKQPSFFCPRPIMMNTAFGRAYGVESSGELIKSSSLYVERSLVFDYGARIMETWDVNKKVNVSNFGTFLLVRN